MEASLLVCSFFSFLFPLYFSQNLLFYFSFPLSTEVNGGLALYYAAFLKTPPSHPTDGEAEACALLYLSILSFLILSRTAILFYRRLIGSGSVIDSLVAAFNFLANDFTQLDTSIYAAYYSQDTYSQNNNTSSANSQSRNYQDIAHAFELIHHPLLPALLLPLLSDDVTAEESFMNSTSSGDNYNAHL